MMLSFLYTHGHFCVRSTPDFTFRQIEVFASEIVAQSFKVHFFSMLGLSRQMPLNLEGHLLTALCPSLCRMDMNDWHM